MMAPGIVGISQYLLEFHGCTIYPLSLFIFMITHWDYGVCNSNIHLQFEYSMSQQSEFSDDTPLTWIQWFCQLDDHHFLCQINPDYIKQPFNIYGLNQQFKHFQLAYSMILSPKTPEQFELEDKKFIEIFQEATQLYGLIHARYIATPEGLAIIRERYLQGKYGHCPRVLCEKQNVIPIGISEQSKIARVKVYCPRCKDIYAPKKKCSDIDGAFFGTSFPHLLLMTYPDISPQFSRIQYTPTVYGFKLEAEEKSKEQKSQKVIETREQMGMKHEIGTSAETKTNKKKKRRN